jgi:hypothetical protein
LIKAKEGGGRVIVRMEEADDGGMLVRSGSLT